MFACYKDCNFVKMLEGKCIEAINYLSCKLQDGHYSGRSFYGETYTALAMAIVNFDKYKDKILDILYYYNKRSKNEENFHWEFNNYALLKLKKLYPEICENVNSPLVYRGIKCTNWTLLRCVDKLIEGISIDDENPKKILYTMQQKNGLILDERHVASFQYHCFIVSLIYDLYQYTMDSFYIDCFRKGIEFIEKFTLKNGDTLLIGRGQEQVFGYGVLIHIYWLAYDLFHNTKYLKLLSQVLNYVFSFWNDENILPLVLNKYEKDSEKTLDVTDRRHLGWYSYNNYYDYISFFIYYLAETRRLMSVSVEIDNCFNSTNESFFYCDGEFLRYSKLKWELVMGCKRYASANALVFPYITYNGKMVSSLCGGEDFFDVGYYQPEGISLPYGQYLNKFFHLFDSKMYFRKVLRGIKEHNNNISDPYLWILGDLKLYIDEVHSECGLLGECTDYKYERKIVIANDELFIAERIRFKKNVSYKYFVPMSIMFPFIEMISNKTYRIPEGKLIFDDVEKAKIDIKKFMTAKAEVDRLIIILDNYKAKCNEQIEINYRITCQ